MREILGRRRRLLSQRSDGRPELIGAALTFATEWQWPVLPGVAADPRGRGGCACPDPDCSVPGAHPFDPGLLAATTDERMVRWWWTNRPTAPIVLATGAPSRSAGALGGEHPARSACPPPRPPGPSPRSTAEACVSARSSPRPPAGRCS